MRMCVEHSLVNDLLYGSQQTQIHSLLHRAASSLCISPQMKLKSDTNIQF